MTVKSLSPTLSTTLKVSILEHEAHDDTENRQTDYQYTESRRSHKARKYLLSCSEKARYERGENCPNSCRCWCLVTPFYKFIIDLANLIIKWTRGADSNCRALGVGLRGSQPRRVYLTQPRKRPGGELRAVDQPTTLLQSNAKKALSGM